MKFGQVQPNARHFAASGEVRRAIFTRCWEERLTRGFAGLFGPLNFAKFEAVKPDTSRKWW